MGLTLMYITNNPVIAQIAQEAGVDRIWIDMEYIGKDERQGGMDTVKNHHTIDDIKKLRPIVTNAELMVRVNPLHTATADYCSSEVEINQAIKAGADVIMLPMFKTVDDVKKFVSYVDGRAKVQLLVETVEAAANIDSILEVPGIDEVHIGLNDLHIAMHKTFMFELICDDTVSYLCNKIKEKGIKYGFGGIARVGYGMLPAEHIIAEHYHLGSTAAILSRGFCDANVVKDPMEIESIFADGVRNIRLKELEVAQYSEEQYQNNLNIIREKVSVIVENKKGKG
ncbi:aldolase/citrate lyase family protein [Enterocloster sp. HCN-30185]|uniref:aldolase/citrate lyase family protein n=1 Tax=Enterocloster sp. HCN-30185 TaxID=3134663 RepID=UPI0030BFD323